MDTLDRQISDQIEGATRVIVSFSDYDHGEALCIYEQPEGDWIESWGRSKRIPAELLEELKSMFDGREFYCTDPETIPNGGSYDDFFNKFWNNL